MHQVSSSSSSSTTLLGSLFFLTFELILTVFFIVCWWRIFTKAGQEGWKSLIPIYNLYIMLKIAGRPGWWILLFLIPLVNIVIIFIFYMDFAKAFGHDIGMTLLLFFLPIIGFPILAFGSSQYVRGTNQPLPQAAQPVMPTQPAQIPNPPTTTTQ